MVEGFGSRRFGVQCVLMLLSVGHISYISFGVTAEALGREGRLQYRVLNN